MTKDKKNILIVDDDDSIREAIKETLLLKNYNVIEARNGVTGLKKYAEEPVDLIILDLLMPRMDGYMFMERLNEIVKGKPHTNSPPPILILTASEYKEDLGLSKQLGAVEFIQKPYEMKDLLHKISTALSS